MANQLFENIKAIKANTMPSDIKMIDVDKLNSSSENYFDMNRIEELAETILGQGSVKENLIVTPLPTGDYEIISGHRRAAAVRLLLQKGENVSRFLPCLVQKYKNDEDKMLDLVLMNVSTRRLTDAELYRSFEIVSDILAKKKEAGEKFGKIRDTLAGYFNISSSKVGQMQNVQKYATPEVKAALDNGDISISTANQIARLSDKEQAEFASKANSDNIKLKDVKAKVDTNVKLPINGNAEKVDTNVKFPDTSNSEKSATSSNYPTISNSEKIDTNVKFSNNTGDKKTISISDPFIVDLVEKLIERRYEKLVSIYESCDKPEFMCPKKDSAEHMVGLSIFSYAKEHFPDLFPDDE